MSSLEVQRMSLTSSMYHQLLAQHDIYFVAFDAKEQIVASNYPVATLTLESLDDLVFLVGPMYSAQIRAFCAMSVKHWSLMWPICTSACAN